MRWAVLGVAVAAAGCAATRPPAIGTTSEVIAVSLDGQIQVFAFISKDGHSRPEDAEKCATHPQCVQLVKDLQKGGKLAAIELQSNEPDSMTAKPSNSL